MNVGALVLITAGVSLALAGREVARSAADNREVAKALLGLGMLVVGTVGVLLGIQLMVAVGY